MVYRKSIDFVAWSQALLEGLPPGSSVRGQLERASTSIPLNIAEGNGKGSPRDRARFWQIALGSAVECAACLDVAVARGSVPDETAAAGKRQLLEIANMLGALVSRLGAPAAAFAGKVEEHEEGYSSGVEEEEEKEEGK